MTTTEELREALRSVEPAWPATDSAMVRRRALRVRLKRRIAGLVAVLAGVAAVATVGPVVLEHTGDPGPATASLGDAAAVPRTADEAARRTDLTVRTGPLPAVRGAGPVQRIGYREYGFQLRPAAAGLPGARGCMLLGGTSEQCEALSGRDLGGWLHLGVLDEVGAGETMVLGVVEAPVAAAVAEIGTRQAPTRLLSLGYGYVLVVASAPRSSGSPDSLAGFRLWAFDDRARLVAARV
jgi:hypothetical protein